jgi:hypothetical protein
MDRGKFLLANHLTLAWPARGRQVSVFQERFALLKNLFPREFRGGLWEGHSSMLHVTCDCCGKDIRPGDNYHYVVKIEAYAAQDPAEITEADLDEDHMEAVSELLRDMEDNGANADMVEPYKNFRYDLCPECHKKFVRDPLGRENAQKFHFSEN